MAQCGNARCACAVYPTFHDAPGLAGYYPLSRLTYEARDDGLTAVMVTMPRRDNRFFFGDGGGGAPVYEPLSPGPKLKLNRK